MNSNSTEVLSNKENIGCKATFTESTQRRAFGTDITNIVIGQIDIDQIDASDP